MFREISLQGCVGEREAVRNGNHPAHESIRAREALGGAGRARTCGVQVGVGGLATAICPAQQHAALSESSAPAPSPASASACVPSPAHRARASESEGSAPASPRAPKTMVPPLVLVLLVLLIKVQLLVLLTPAPPLMRVNFQRTSARDSEILLNGILVGESKGVQGR